MGICRSFVAAHRTAVLPGELGVGTTLQLRITYRVGRKETRVVVSRWKLRPQPISRCLFFSLFGRGRLGDMIVAVVNARDTERANVLSSSSACK